LRSSPLARRLLVPFLVGASLWYLFFFVVAATLRASFPMQLEWVESGILDTVARAFAHQPIYVAPSHLFVPYVYTPLYYHVAAAICHIAGLGFAPLRWLSIVCTLGCFALIFALTRQFTASRQAGFFAAGCFAALYGASAAAYDIARVDMLFLLLVLAAVYAIWRQQALLAGLLFAGAYQAKQGAAIIAVCLFLGIWRRPRQSVTGLVTFLALAISSILLMNRASGGWYDFYTLWLPSHEPLDAPGLFYFFARDIGRYLLPGLCFIAWNALRDPRRWWQSRRANFLLAAAVGTFLTSLAGRVHSGGSANAVVPFYAWFAVLFGVALHRHFATPPEQPFPHRALGRVPLVSALAVLQLLISFTPPARFVPSSQSRQQARAFMQEIAAVPGDIYVIDAAADLIPAHKTSFANGVPVWDIIRAGDSAAGRALIADLQQSIHQRSYAALLSPYAPRQGQLHFTGAPHDISADYQLEVPPLVTGDAARELKIIQTPPIGPAYLFPVRH
jgi:Glycosyltransferase family 87